MKAITKIEIEIIEEIYSLAYMIHEDTSDKDFVEELAELEMTLR